MILNIKISFFSLALLTFWTCTPLKNQDATAVVPNKNQKGRLEVANISNIEDKSSKVKLICDIYNTGQTALNLPDESDGIEINFDENELEQNGLSEHIAELEKAIKGMNATLGIGKFIFKQKISYGYTDTSSTDKGDKVAFFGSASYEDNNAYIDEKHCADLQIDSVFVIKRAKNWAKVGYRITNKGKGPANLFKKGNDIYNNLSLKFYISRSDRLTRGSLLVGETFLEDNKSNKSGLLPVGASYIGETRLDLVKYTKFTPTLIYSLDEYNKVKECDETNNTASVSIAR